MVAFEPFGHAVVPAEFEPGRSCGARQPPWQARPVPLTLQADGVPRGSWRRRAPTEPFREKLSPLEHHQQFSVDADACRSRTKSTRWPAATACRSAWSPASSSGCPGYLDRADRRRFRHGRGRRLDRATRRPWRHRDYLRYPARQPLRQGGRRGDCTEWQAVYGTIDRDNTCRPEPDDRSARRGRSDRAVRVHSRPATVPPSCRRSTRPSAASSASAPGNPRPNRVRPRHHGATADPVEKHRADLRRHADHVRAWNLSVSTSERVCLVGRNGSGKSTLLKIAAGLIEADSGSRFAQPGATIRYLPQEPDLRGFATTLAYVEAGLGPGDDHNRAFYLLGHLGLNGEEFPRTCRAARRAAPRWRGCWRPSPISCCWTSRPTIST